MPSRKPRIALLIQTATEWGRSLLKGIADFAQDHAGWEFFIEPHGPFERLRIPPGWKGDGIIARVDHAALENAILRTRLPAVNVSWLGLRFHRLPHVVSDQMACGRLAARHFVDKGFKHFGYVGPLDAHRHHDELGRRFVSAVGELGCHGAFFSPRRRAGRRFLSTLAASAQLARWLEQLPKPAGLLVWSDGRALEVLSACARVSLRVPDEVAILSAEHDAVVTSLSSIPFSSLDMVPAKVGYVAAALLNHLLAGKPPPAKPVSIPPIGIIQRQSSETTAIDDPEVSKALLFIREQASRPIQVGEVVRAAALSRRTLEERFTSLLGRSPAAEIRQVRLERVKRLLLETDWAVPVIAEKTGFNHVEVMIRSFSRQFGMPPGKFRRCRQPARRG